jgi:hypothetical protein
VIVFASILETRASLGLAIQVVTWAAIVFLGLIVVSLHIRLQRLERLEARRERAEPYGHLIGQTLGEVLNGQALTPMPRLLLFLSPACPSCERLLAELRSSNWDAPVALIWTEDSQQPPPEVPPNLRFLPGGAKISGDLGVRVTPFAMVADRDGKILRAFPINSLEPLRDLLRPSREVASLAHRG